MPTTAFMSQTTPAATRGLAPARSNGCRLVAADGRELILRAVELRTHAAGGVARVSLRQRWHNPYAEPLRVTYQLPLPADGAVSGYAFTIGGERTKAHIARKHDAREAFEEAVASGQSAALLEQERSSLFTQELGNLPPDEEVLVEVDVDQPLQWLARGPHAGGWEWRFPTVIAPRYLGADARVADAEKVSPDISEALPAARVQLSMSIGDAIVDGGPSSPSHDLRGSPESLELGTEAGSGLDRDLVVRWPVAAATPGVSLSTYRAPATASGASSEAFGLLTIVPPKLEGPAPSIPRDLCVLLDVSGSMSGEPLEQARRVVGALIDSLDEHDQLELIAFSWQPERWCEQPQRMSPSGKSAAHAWLREVSVGGATEMRAGITEALRPLRTEAQRQILLVSDGLIGFESEIIAEIRSSLPGNARVHTLGVGHAVNRSLTGPAARAGGGFEAIVAPGEDVEGICEQLLARTCRPQLIDLQLEGGSVLDRAPHRVGDLFAGAPVRIALKLDAAGGVLGLRGTGPGGSWAHQLEVPPIEAGTGSPRIATRYARESVEDLELERASADAGHDVDARIESLGLAFGISTRMTSWVAIDARTMVDASAPSRVVQVPQALAAGLSAQGVGLRRGPRVMAFTAMAPVAPAQAFPKRSTPKRGGGGSLFGRAAGALRSQRKKARPAADEAREREAAPAPSANDEGPSADDTDEAIDLTHESAGAGLPLTARVLLDRDGTLVVVFEHPLELEWDPRRGLQLLDAEGNTLQARLVPERSTAASSVPAGLSLRIALEYDTSAGTPQTLLTCGLELQLSR